MPLAFGATVHDGRYTKIFTVTAVATDAAENLAVVFDGAGGRPTAFNVADLRPVGAPLYATVTRVDTGAAGQLGARSEFSYHTLTAAGISVRKLTADTPNGVNTVTAQIVVRAISPSDR